jgi:hypothetical protein
MAIPGVDDFPVMEVMGNKEGLVSFRLKQPSNYGLGHRAAHADNADATLSERGGDGCNRFFFSG